MAFLFYVDVLESVFPLQNCIPLKKIGALTIRALVTS